MEIEAQDAGPVKLFRIRGRLDSTTSPIFEARILPGITPESSRIVLDFTGVDYVSSAGLRVVLLVAKQVKSRAGSFAIFGMLEPVQQVFQMSGFSRIIPMFAAEAEAVAAA